MKTACVCLFTSLFLCLTQPKKSGRRREPINASTADEAIKKVLEQKRISTKINYDVLKDLNKSSPKSPTRQSEEPSAGVKKTPTGRQRNPQLSSPKMAKTVSSFGKRYEDVHLYNYFLPILQDIFTYTFNHSCCSKKLFFVVWPRKQALNSRKFTADLKSCPNQVVSFSLGCSW